MTILSDSEGTCSDFEVISSSKGTARGTGEQSSETSISLPSSEESTASLENVEMVPTSLTSSGIAGNAISSSTGIPNINTAESSDMEDTRPTRSNSIVLPPAAAPRRERRDTDRQRQKRSHDHVRIDRREEGIRQRDILLAVAVLGGSCIMACCWYTISTGDELEIMKLKERLADLEFLNHRLLMDLRGEESVLKQKNARLEQENKKLQDHLVVLSAQLQSTRKELQQADETILSLEKLADEEIPDRYGFDIPFKLCHDILQHEKLCRLISEGLKAVVHSDHDAYD